VKVKRNYVQHNGMKVLVAESFQKQAESLWAAIGNGSASPIDIIAQGLQVAYRDGFLSPEPRK
jgi:hypothetical protein